MFFISSLLVLFCLLQIIVIRLFYVHIKNQKASLRMSYSLGRQNLVQWFVEQGIDFKRLREIGTGLGDVEKIDQPTYFLLINMIHRIHAGYYIKHIFHPDEWETFMEQDARNLFNKHAPVLKTIWNKAGYKNYFGKDFQNYIDTQIIQSKRSHVGPGV